MKTNAFVKQLASNKRATRENALSTLKKFLSSKEKAKKIQNIDLKKLWKGLFYTMWFCDRPRPQQRLANELALLFSEDVVEELFCEFVESFWSIMILEWRELDKWRCDKFLMLMRYVIRECFVRIQDSYWDLEKLREYLEVMKRVIIKDDEKTPRALTYHIIDVWVDEIERVVFTDEEEGDKNEEVEDEDEEKDEIDLERRKAIIKEKNVPFDELLAPFKELCGKKNFEGLKKKIRMEILEDERLHALGIDCSLIDGNDEVEEEDEEEAVEEEDEVEEEEWKGFGN